MGKEGLANLINTIEKLGDDLEKVTFEIRVPAGQNPEEYIDNVKARVNGNNGGFEVYEVHKNLTYSNIYHLHIRKKGKVSPHA